MRAELLVVLALIVLAVGFALVLLARWRPERVAMLLAVVAVVIGAAAAGVHVADGIDDKRVHYGGELDTEEVLRSFHRFVRQSTRPRNSSATASVTSTQGRPR